MAVAEVVRREIEQQEQAARARRNAVDQAGDDYMNGEWLEEVIDRFCEDEGGCDLLFRCLVGIADLETVERAPQGAMRDWHRSQGMSAVDAFLSKHLAYPYERWAQRFIERKAAEAHTEAIGEMTRDVFEEAMSHYEEWLDSLPAMSDADLERMAKAEGLELLAGLAAYAAAE